MACVVVEKLEFVDGDNVEVEPCPAELELDCEDVVVLESVVAAVLEGVVVLELASVVVVASVVSVPDVEDSVEGANELLGSLLLHLET